MKKFLIILIISLLVGCLTTQRQVSTMYDWELRNEYSDLQLKHMQLEREMMYGGLSYSYIPIGGMVMTSASNPAIEKLNKAEKRMREIENEMSRRGILP